MFTCFNFFACLIFFAGDSSGLNGQTNGSMNIAPKTKLAGSQERSFWLSSERSERQLNALMIQVDAICFGLTHLEAKKPLTTSRIPPETTRLMRRCFCSAKKLHSLRPTPTPRRMVVIKMYRQVGAKILMSLSAEV